MKSISIHDTVSIMGFAAALGCGLMAGVFFAFSTFIMKALSRLPAETGIAAMQSINVFAIRSWFLVAFLGTSVVCGLVTLAAIGEWRDPSAALLIAGGAVFLIGCFLVTMVFNVPMNNALAALPSDAPDRVFKWNSYVSLWTRWNHVRTIASLAAAALLMTGSAGERKPLRPALALDQQTLVSLTSGQAGTH